MKLSEAAERVIGLAKVIREYWETELPKRHPGYPVMNPGEQPLPPPPEEKKLAKLFASLPEDMVYQIGAQPVRVDIMTSVAGLDFVAAHSCDVDANWKSVIEWQLDNAGWRFVWPIAFVATDGARRVVRQVVPRSFTRTRLVDLLFAPEGEKRDAFVEDGARAKAGAQAVQKMRASGDGGPESLVIEAFRCRLAEVCAVFV